MMFLPKKQFYEFQIYDFFFKNDQSILDCSFYECACATETHDGTPISMKAARLGAVSTTWQCWKANSCPIINIILKQTLLEETPDVAITLTPKERDNLVKAFCIKQREGDTYVEDPFIQVKYNYANKIL